MEVILRDHVENVGNRGEIVKVADGYARNYLLPRGLALRVTPGNVKHVERERERVETRAADERRAAEAVAAQLAAVVVSVRRKVGETDVLYGSVTAADIADDLSGRGFTIDKRRVQLDDPIKRLGEHEVPVKLHREVVVALKVIVVAEGAPARAPEPGAAPEQTRA